MLAASLQKGSSMRAPRPWTAPGRAMRSAADTLAGRLRLLRLLSSAGPVPASGLIGLYALGAVLPVSHALATGHLTTVLAGGGGERRVVIAAALVAGLLLADQASWLLRTAVRAFVVARVDGRQRAAVRALAAGLPMLETLESQEFQDSAARATDNGTAVDRTRSAGTAATGQAELTFRLAGALTAAGLLATFSPVLAAVVLVASLTVRAVLRRQWLHLIDTMDADIVGQRRTLYLSELAVTGAVKDVRLFGLSDFLAGRFRASGMAAYGPLWRELWKVLRRQWWTLGAIAASAALVFAAPAVAAMAGRISPGEMVTFVLAGLGVLAISGMGQEAFDIEYGLRGVQEADQLSRTYAQATVTEPRAVPTTRAATPPLIRFENVRYHYPGAGTPVLDDFSLTIRPGERLAVVGANGVGKTTFVKLLSGLYRPDAGRITVDGVGLEDFGLVRWRRRLTVLFQDFVEYPVSLRENITMTAPEQRGDAAVRAALERAGGAYLVDQLADGLDTLLWREGSGGTGLSGGQWQRVALARILFAHAAGRQLLVLDEPTAHLDVRAEATFHERIVRQVSGATTVLISHRLSTVRPADRIVLLGDGRVAEEGTHDELLERGGEYARFFTVQAAAFAGPPTAEEGLR